MGVKLSWYEYVNEAAHQLGTKHVDKSQENIRVNWKISYQVVKDISEKMVGNKLNHRLLFKA